MGKLGKSIFIQARIWGGSERHKGPEGTPCGLRLEEIF